MGGTWRDESGQNEHANCACGHGGTPSPSRVRSEHHWIRYAYGNAASVSPLMVFGLIVATSRKPLTLVPAGAVGGIVTAIVPQAPRPGKRGENRGAGQATGESPATPAADGDGRGKRVR